MFSTNINYNKTIRFLFWLVYFILINIAVYKYIALPTETMLIADNRYKARDFDYHMIVINSYLHGEIDTIYDQKSQQIALSNFFKIKTPVAWLLGISPTALVIWLPFALLFQIKKLLSYTIWVALSLTAFTIAIDKSLKYVASKSKVMVPWLMVRFLFFIISFAMIACLVLGQTTVMACALLMLLILEIYKAKDERRFLRPWVVYPLVFFLTIKIPYIVLALGMLFVFGYFYELLFSVLFILGISALIGIWKGFVLYKEWFQQLAIYSSSVFPDHYSAHHILDTIINFRSAFSMYLGSDTSNYISKLFLLIGLLFIFSISFVRYLYPSFLQNLTSKMKPPQISVLLVGLFLLFMPYLGEYEDLLIIVLYVISAVSIEKYPDSIIFNILSAFCLCFVLNFKIFHPTNFLWIFWLMKVFVFGSLYINLKGKMGLGIL
jgi:hypothetical protein